MPGRPQPEPGLCQLRRRQHEQSERGQSLPHNRPLTVAYPGTLKNRQPVVGTGPHWLGGNLQVVDVLVPVIPNRWQ